MVLLTKAAAGASLSIYRNSTNKVWIEATSPLDIGYRLQASVDFQNWSDLSDQVSGLLSYRIDPTEDANRFFRLRTWTTTDLPVRLVMLGDSTVADYVLNSSQYSGWGQGMYGYLKPNVQVINLAISLQSTKSFLSSIQKDYLMRIKPEFVLIPFGRVDALTLSEPYYTSIAEYEANLKTIIQIVRDFDGTPILVTPTGPREFDDNGKIVPSLEDRCQVVRNVADESQAYLIDLHELSNNLYNELGPINSAYISSGNKDNVHFSLKGADIIAGLAVDAFPIILRAQLKHVE
ncbi:MAG: hypothetical protein HYY23_01790 [Verrucomicrobia bacterium]|nr:hypothetical protein [Verrucomicrobiota bacterium]